jgi:hypothetical protein
MDAETKKMLAMTAHMEGQEVVIAKIGKAVSVSEMELICLANFAEIGIMSLFSELDGKPGEDAQEMLNQHLDRIRKDFASRGGHDGLDRLSQGTAALLRGNKFFGYIA